MHVDRNIIRRMTSLCTVNNNASEHSVISSLQNAVEAANLEKAVMQEINFPVENDL